MGLLAVSGCQCMCSFGSKPCALLASQFKVMIEGKPVCSITDTVFQVPGPSFGTCTSPVPGPLPFLPRPCVCTIPIWIGGNPMVLIDGRPALEMGNTAICTTFAGVVSVVMHNQIKVL